MSKRTKITDILSDEKNFNRHTEYGMSLLQKSIEKVGVIESITVSADDKIITGNARQEKFLEVFGDEVQPIIVETDGKRPVVLRRVDINSGTKQFHEAALLANTVAKKNIDLDAELIREVLVEEFEADIEELGMEEADNINLSDFFDGSQAPDAKKGKAVICPHCGKDINKSAEEYENDGDN
ncbi:MAG: hypothetical protein LBQ60_14905 [Bacteroidales bacterium]|jgi:copper chaperone CopZ|nr:hypothetical protein [Bacteroidales bacterium]